METLPANGAQGPPGASCNIKLLVSSKFAVLRDLHSFIPFILPLVGHVPRQCILSTPFSLIYYFFFLAIFVIKEMGTKKRRRCMEIKWRRNLCRIYYYRLVFFNERNLILILYS